MINNFRYNSSWEDFEEAVNKIKELLKLNKVYWLIGCIEECGLGVDDDAFAEIEEIQDIIGEEILYLLYSCLNGIGINYTEMRRTLSNPINNVSDAEIETLLMSVQNKFELVKDAFVTDKLKMRYKLKMNSVNHKLSDFNYNVLSQSLPDGSNARYALVNMSCRKKLKKFGAQGIERLLEEKEPATEITFICDEDDIDVLISQLEEIKQKVKESYNDGNSYKNR